MVISTLNINMLCGLRKSEIINGQIYDNPIKGTQQYV